ncbi:hypothetical protein C8R47DRAFT_1031835 [Mycena vitilis]|nr:hypothetical protein C8R47DRAFT_1031835 [Mycena vitilis]
MWSWEIEFEGISVSLVGTTPPSGYNQTFELTDPGASADKPYTYPAPGVGGQFYTSLIAPFPGALTISLYNANGIMIDYALVTAGNSTNLQGRSIIVDDTSPEILWDGKWSALNNFTLPVTSILPSMEVYEAGRDPSAPEDFIFFIANVSSHAGTTHRTSNVGDSFSFQFAGTSLQISGITPGAGQNWLLHMEFTVDGNTTTKIFTPIPGDDRGAIPNFVYFDATFDAAVGNHTLVAKVVDAAGSPPPAAQIDYITYRPSFVTIGSKPNFLAPASNGTGAPSSTSSSTYTMAPLPAFFDFPVEHRTSVGAIVGAVLGGCLVIALLAGTFYLVRRRRTRKREQFGVSVVSPSLRY